jgi:glycosyltransferase involved in cell wall biosynthesis
MEAVYLEYIREGERFAARVNRHLFRTRLDPTRDVFYGCMTVCLETLQRLAGMGIFSVVDQFDPARVEQDLVEQERAKWPGWEAMTGRVPEAYFERCAAEWEAASAVLVYSPWTRDAIVQQGVPAEKVFVVPLAYEAPAVAPASSDGSAAEVPRIRAAGQPMTVLWLGTVILRKGIPYLIEAARRLRDRNIRFVVAGQIGISDQAVKSAPPNMQFIGRVVRGQAEAVYRSADLFVLPTISDSFALTQVEAMGQGLPVIATTRCGAVVSDGVDGKIVPVGDAEALAQAIAQLDEDPELLARMSAAARVKARQFSLQQYGELVRAEVVRRRPELGG